MRRFGRIMPLSEANCAPYVAGIYRIIDCDPSGRRHPSIGVRRMQAGRVCSSPTRPFIYVGQSANLRRRLMDHRRAITRFDIPDNRFCFQTIHMPGSNEQERVSEERKIIERSRRNFCPTNQREFEQMLAVAAAQNELEETQSILYRQRSREGEFFAVHRVTEVPRQVNQRPRFRIASGRLSPAAARSAGQRMPGVFVVGAAQHAAAFARSIANRTGGTVSGPEHHQDGISHYHVTAPGRRIHIWYRNTLPSGEFLY